MVLLSWSQRSERFQRVMPLYQNVLIPISVGYLKVAVDSWGWPVLASIIATKK